MKIYLEGDKTAHTENEDDFILGQLSFTPKIQRPDVVSVYEFEVETQSKLNDVWVVLRYRKSFGSGTNHWWKPKGIFFTEAEAENSVKTLTQLRRERISKARENGQTTHHYEDKYIILQRRMS